MRAWIIFTTIKPPKKESVTRRVMIADDSVGFDSAVRLIYLNGGILIDDNFVPYHQIILIERILEEANEPTESAPTVPNNQA